MLLTVELEKTLESPLDCKETQPVHPKGNQSRIFIERTDAETETPILWPPDAKNWLLGKDPDAGEDWWQEEKGMTEDVMVGWHHGLYAHEYDQAPGAGDGQESLACLQSMGSQRVGHNWATELNWTLLKGCSLCDVKVITPNKRDRHVLIPSWFPRSQKKSLLGGHSTVHPTLFLEGLYVIMWKCLINHGALIVEINVDEKV